MYNRVQLRATIYEIPDRVEDCAAQIIEHLRSVTIEDLSARKLAELFQTAGRFKHFAQQEFLPASGRSQLTMVSVFRLFLTGTTQHFSPDLKVLRVIMPKLDHHLMVNRTSNEMYTCNEL